MSRYNYTLCKEGKQKSLEQVAYDPAYALDVCKQLKQSNEIRNVHDCAQGYRQGQEIRLKDARNDMACNTNPTAYQSVTGLCSVAAKDARNSLADYNKMCVAGWVQQDMALLGSRYDRACGRIS
jgi:hypothetical protein